MVFQQRQCSHTRLLQFDSTDCTDCTESERMKTELACCASCMKGAHFIDGENSESLEVIGLD